MKAGIGVIAFAGLSTCLETLPPVVWEGDTQRDEASFIRCLASYDAFKGIEYIPGARSRHGGSRTYGQMDGPTIVFPEDARDYPERVFARAGKALSSHQIEILEDCLTVRHD